MLTAVINCIPDIHTDAAEAMIVPQQETQQDINVNVFVVDWSRRKGDVTEYIDHIHAHISFQKFQTYFDSLMIPKYPLLWSIYS